MFAIRSMICFVDLVVILQAAVDSVAPFLIIFLLVAVSLALAIASAALFQNNQVPTHDKSKGSEALCSMTATRMKVFQLEETLANLTRDFQIEKAMTAHKYETLRWNLTYIDLHHEQRATELVEIMEERVRKDMEIRSQVHQRNFTRFVARVNATLAKNREDIDLLKKGRNSEN